MSSDLTVKARKGLLISNTGIVLFVFATAFFPRVLSAMGLPVAINFLHFLTIPLLCGFALTRVSRRSWEQVLIGRKLFISLASLFTVIITSALLNSSGLINILLEFLLLGEPFILLLTLVCIFLTPADVKQIHVWLLRFALVNYAYAFGQYFVLKLGLGFSILGQVLVGVPKNVFADNIKGVFVGQGAGHVVGASVSLSFAVYYYVTAKSSPLWFRILLIILALIHIVISDAKQVLLVFLVALILFLFTKLNNFIEILRYLLITLGFIGLLIWAGNTIFPALTTWLDIKFLEEGILNLKLSVFQIIVSHYTSPLNWVFGLGPGHTVGRLGGWIVWEYQELLQPFDLTTSSASKAVWSAVANTWIGSRSSLFSPLFTWAGMWGDLGILGLAVYLYTCLFIWSKVCLDDLSRFLLLTIGVFGLIFSQMEEPGYMLLMAMLIGLQWHRNKFYSFQKKSSQRS